MRVDFARGRYELRNAALVDLIHTAWSVDPEEIVGGPDFLDTRRFDVIAKAPADSTPDALHAMLRNLLGARFQLVERRTERDRPAYAITVSRKPELQPADGSETAACAARPGQPATRPGVPARPIDFDCQNMTMAALARALPTIREASGYIYNYPVLEGTGLTGAWNFSLRWRPRVMYFPGLTAGEPVTLFDSLEKLGLKLALSREPAPAIVVESVHEMPTPNPPGIAHQPALRPAFEVADVKQARGRPECSNVEIRRGGAIEIYMTLKGLIAEAQGDMNRHRIVGLPKSDGPAGGSTPKRPPRVTRPDGSGRYGMVWTSTRCARW